MTSSNSDNRLFAEDSPRFSTIHALMSSSLSHDLLGDDAAADLALLCDRLPVDLSTFWGFEAPLGTDRPELDFLIEIKRGAPGHALLRGHERSLLDSMVERSAPWRDLRTFAQAWARGDAFLHEHVRNLWIEFDLVAARAAGVDAVNRPCVFWGPSPEASTNHQRLVEVLDTVRDAFGQFPPAFPREIVKEAVRRLPPGARVFQIGAMQSRGDVVLRMCVNGIAPGAVPDWLDAVAWSGDITAVRDTLGELAAVSRTTAIDVDFTARGAGPKLGIECYQHWREVNPTQWDALLDYATARGLCRPSKRRALAAFPAKTEFPLNEQVTSKRRGFLFPVLYRNVHHVKVSFVGGGCTEAKAYLGVSRPGVNISGFFGDASGVGEDGWYIA